MPYQRKNTGVSFFLFCFLVFRSIVFYFWTQMGVRSYIDFLGVGGVVK